MYSAPGEVTDEREVVKVEVHRLIVIFERSLIHFTFIFFSPLNAYGEFLFKQDLSGVV